MNNWKFNKNTARLFWQLLYNFLKGVDKVLTTGRIPGREFYADVFRQKRMKITQKVFVPVREYPKVVFFYYKHNFESHCWLHSFSLQFNFSGKILGPKGNTLRRLEQEVNCKIAIKGRNSMRDRVKEEQLRKNGDPRNAHFHKDLYVEISAVATPAECYARIAYALAEIRKYLIPDKNDDISQDQKREMNELNPETAAVQR